IDIELIKPLFEKVVKLNTRIAEEGLSESYGVNIGSCIQKNIDLGIYGDDRRNRCAGFAAAGSDARMSGCPLPVMTTSGSGNQGMTASLPVIKYCRLGGYSDEQMIRALFLSHLSTIHIKTNVGRLSAYCGAMCAAAAAGGAIAFLIGGDFRTVSSAIINTLGNISGVICDGAKASCAMKIATSIYTAFDSATLAHYHKVLHGGEGIVGKDVEETIRNIGELAQTGMRKTDEVILEIMTK
ncbi:L-serine ammonia-lyase, iron-sulfur-dependent, subunit alpha, partial [Verrucomicrobiota bacterium]